MIIKLYVRRYFDLLYIACQYRYDCLRLYVHECKMFMELYVCYCNDLFLKHANLVIGFNFMHVNLIEYLLSMLLSRFS